MFSQFAYSPSAPAGVGCGSIKWRARWVAGDRKLAAKVRFFACTFSVWATGSGPKGLGFCSFGGLRLTQETPRQFRFTIMKRNISQILNDVKTFVKGENLDDVIRFLVIDSETDNQQDVDIFLEVKNSTDRFKLIFQTSLIAASLSIRHDILVSIYPVLSDTISNKENQFAVNLADKSREF